MSHVLANNITSDQLEAEKYQGRNQNCCDEGDEYPDLKPIRFGYALRNLRVLKEFRCCQCSPKGTMCDGYACKESPAVYPAMFMEPSMKQRAVEVNM